MDALKIWRAMMLGVALTFCIISQIQSLPVYPYPSPGPPPGYYVQAIDPYSVPYQSVDPYASLYPSVDPYASSYGPVDPYASPYPSVDPYASPYPSVDPYASQYPSVDPYSVQYQSIDPYAVSYQSVDPYGLPQQQYGVPQQAQYSPAYVSPADLYSLPQQQSYSVPYSQPSPVYVPSVDTYYQTPSQSPSPYPSSDPYNVPQPQNYQLAPSYPQIPAYAPQNSYTSQVVVEQDTYNSITFHEMAEQKHCGVIPATNDALYTGAVPGGINDVVPYGAIPWNVIIVDNDDQNVVCMGTRLHTGLTLTLSSCIYGPASKYSVVQDWDILTIYNEYEPYKSLSNSVCRIIPLGIDNSSQPTQFMLGGAESELTLLITPEENIDDQYPAQDWLCLPSKASTLPSPSPYGYQPQSSSVYTQYPQIPYAQDYGYPPSNAECWVAGYRYSPTAILQNHPLPTSTGYQPPDIYQQQYYSSLDNSKVPRKALVRQIQCPSGYSYAGYDDVCFVGVYGYDACVADKGAAIYCVVSEDAEYESGFATDQSSNMGSIPAGSSSPATPYQQQQYQPAPIQVQAAQQKEGRKRAVLYGVVKVPTSCSAPYQPSGYQANQQQSNYVVASRVSPSIRAAIVDLQWTAAFSFSCPAEKVQDVVPSLNLPGYSPGYSPQPQQGPYDSLQPSLYDPSIIVDQYQPPSYQPAPSYQPPPSYQQPPSYQPPSYQPPPSYQQPQVSYQPQPAPSYQPAYQQQQISSYQQPSIYVPPYSDPVSYNPIYNPYSQQVPVLQQYPGDLYGII